MIKKINLKTIKFYILFIVISFFNIIKTQYNEELLIKKIQEINKLQSLDMNPYIIGIDESELNIYQYLNGELIVRSPQQLNSQLNNEILHWTIQQNIVGLGSCFISFVLCLSVYNTSSKNENLTIGTASRFLLGSTPSLAGINLCCKSIINHFKYKKLAKEIIRLLIEKNKKEV